MPPDTKILRWYAATAIIDAPDVAGSPPSSGSAHRAKLDTPYVPVNTSGSATSLAPSSAAASTSERARVRLSAMSSETSSWSAATRRPRRSVRGAATRAVPRVHRARRHASAYWWRGGVGVGVGAASAAATARRGALNREVTHAASRRPPRGHARRPLPPPTRAVARRPPSAAPTALDGRAGRRRASTSDARGRWSAWIPGWKGSLFWAFVGSWVCSLWVNNRARRARDELVDEVAGRAPANDDERLELRALNDVSTDALVRLPALAARRRLARVDGETFLSLLAEAIGRPVREDYVLQRMLMAMAAASDDGALDPRQATVAVLFLSNGPVRERFRAMFDVVSGVDADAAGGADAADGDDGRRVDAAAVAPLLATLATTGQLPPSSRCAPSTSAASHHRAAEDLVVAPGSWSWARTWYIQPDVREFSPAELVARLADGVGPGEPGAADAADGAPAEALRRQLSCDEFVALLESQTVCAWGECRQIAIRRRQQRERDEADEYERNPPSWQFWKWEVFGRRKPPPETPPEAAAS